MAQEAKKRGKTQKKADIAPLGSKRFSVALSNLLALRKELLEHKHAQLSALTMKKIAEKIAFLGFKRPANSLLRQLGTPENGVYQDIPAEVKRAFVEAVGEFWQKGYDQNKAFKAEQKALKRAETLARIAEIKRKRALERKEGEAGTS